MSKSRDIRGLNMQEQRKFLESFDIIMTDCDGVLWLTETPISGALETLKMFQYMGKKIFFLSNNTSRSVENYVKKLQRLGYNATTDQIIVPTLSITWYLKKIGFNKKAMVIATQAFNEVLINDGIDIMTGPKSIEEDIPTLRELVINLPDIGAVIVDFDVNQNYVKLAQAVQLLKKKNVLFLIGSRDYEVPITETQTIMGPGAFVDLLINATGREPVEYAKPSAILKDYVFERYEINDPKRCLFIGDSIATDMKFAELCGFTKLLVDSSIDDTDALHKDYVTPDYVLPNLGLMPSFGDS